MNDGSIILKAKVLDHRRALNFLSRNPSFLNVSYSWNGIGKFNDTLLCGINKADKTNHRLLEMEHEIMLTPPLSFEALDSAVKDHAKTKNTDLGADKFKPYIVTSEQVDIGTKGASTAKWIEPTVVIEPAATLSFARDSDANPDEKNRLIHLSYGELGHTMADLSNVEGGSAAFNVSEFLKVCNNVSGLLELRFNDSKGTLPPYAAKFFYPSSFHLKQLMKDAANKVVQSEVLSTVSSGNFQSKFFNSMKITFISSLPFICVRFPHWPSN